MRSDNDGVGQVTATVAFDHLHVFTDEVDRLVEFLVERLGGRQVAKYAGWQGAHTIVVALGMVRLNITSSGPPTTEGSPHSSHFGVRIDDLDSTVNALRAAGYHVVSEPHDWSPDEVLDDQKEVSLTGRFAFIEAPGGIEIELIERK